MNAPSSTPKAEEDVMIPSAPSPESLSYSLSEGYKTPKSGLREIEECDDTKTEKEKQKNNNNNNNKEEIKIFIYIKEDDKTLSVKTNKNIKIKCILNSIIQQNNNWNTSHKLSLKHKYFLINSKNKHVLNLERTLSHYNIQNKYILILAKKKCRKNKENKKESKKQKKLTIICSFGAPYNNKKLLSSYYGDVSLDQYAYKIKEKFSMCQSIKITFNFRGIPCLGKDRKCGIKKLGIKEYDEIIAQTNGINLTLKSFSSPKNIKVIEMYKYFDLNMLKQQIKIELNIPMNNQKALICKGWRLIDHDTKCREIKQYETITIIECCGCNAIKKDNKHKNNNTECIQHRNNEYYVNQSNHSHSHHNNNNNSPLHLRRFPDYHYYPEPVNYEYPEPLNYEYPEFMEYPPNYTNYINNYEQYGGCDNNNNHYDEYYEYDTSGPMRMDQMDGMDVYPPNQYDDNIDDTAPFNNININNNNNINEEYLESEKLKICRYGNNCRYFKNPHISGPCRYYHPPTTLQHDYSWKSYYTLHHGITKKNKYKTNYTIQ